MELTMAKGFSELNEQEMLEVDGGFAISTIIACALLAVAASPAVVSVGVIVKGTATAINNSYNDERERGRRDGIIQAREDVANGFTDSIYK